MADGPSDVSLIPSNTSLDQAKAILTEEALQLATILQKGSTQDLQAAATRLDHDFHFVPILHGYEPFLVSETNRLLAEKGAIARISETHTSCGGDAVMGDEVSCRRVFIVKGDEHVAAGSYAPDYETQHQ